MIYEQRERERESCISLGSEREEDGDLQRGLKEGKTLNPFAGSEEENGEKRREWRTGGYI